MVLHHSLGCIFQARFQTWRDRLVVRLINCLSHEESDIYLRYVHLARISTCESRRKRCRSRDVGRQYNASLCKRMRNTFSAQPVPRQGGGTLETSLALKEIFNLQTSNSGFAMVLLWFCLALTKVF